MNAPARVFPGKFLAKILLTIHISFNAIANYLRTIPVPFYRGLMLWLISIDIVNRYPTAHSRDTCDWEDSLETHRKHFGNISGT